MSRCPPGKRPPPTPSTEGRCQMSDLLVGRVAVAQSLASSFTTQLWAHILCTTHSGQGVARAVGGRETRLGCSFVLSGRYRSPTDGVSTERHWRLRESPELWQVPPAHVLVGMPGRVPGLWSGASCIHGHWCHHPKCGLQPSVS